MLRIKEGLFIVSAMGPNIVCEIHVNFATTNTHTHKKKLMNELLTIKKEYDVNGKGFFLYTYE